MPDHIDYARSERLPRLGWFADLDRARDTLSVVHGTAIECRDRWMIEGVWDGPFADGDFHRCEHTFGSGIRIDGNAVHFVPSCALVDRLLYCVDGDHVLVANSLVIMLAMTGARLVTGHDYRAEAETILQGIDDYEKRFPVAHSRIECFYQMFYRPLVASGGTLAQRPQPAGREFKTFADYRSKLAGSVAGLIANARDPARRVSLDSFGTLSNGYDSSTITCLVKDLGVKRFFSYSGAWSGEQERFDVRPIAAALQVEPIWLTTNPSEPSAEDELYMQASNPVGYQLPLLQMAVHIEKRCRAAIVFTGYHGDIIWGLHADERYVTSQIRRHDISGFDLTEVRLKCGFINVAVPFLFAESAPSIMALSRSAEMEPWRMHNDYDRPICRRIVEEAGVPRRSFGMHKGGLFGGALRPHNEQLRKGFLVYLRDAHRMSRTAVYARWVFDRLAARALMVIADALPRKGRLAALRPPLRRRFWKLVLGESWVWRRLNLRLALHAWANEQLTRGIGGAADEVNLRNLRTPTADKASGF